MSWPRSVVNLLHPNNIEAYLKKNAVHLHLQASPLAIQDVDVVTDKGFADKAVIHKQRGLA